MKNYIIKIPITILFVSIFALLINSCKKTENGANKNEAVDYRAKAIQATIERYGHITAPIIFQPRQPASTISYKDANGNLILYGGTQYNRNNRTAAVCGQYDCGTAPNPSDLFVTITLEYVKWFYTCGPNSTGQHDLMAIWKVSTPYALLDEDPNNPGNYSYGNIRIKSGSTVLVTSSDLTAVIESLGVDPNCSSNTLYNVTYSWLDVADSYFPGNTMECSFTIYNDCSITSYNTTVGYTFGANYRNLIDPFTHPCDRIDQAFVNPNTGPNNEATILGAYNACTAPNGYTITTDHQVEYRIVNNGSSYLWDDQTSTVYWGSTGSSPTPEAATMNSQAGILFLHYMTSSSGTWLVRYRNRNTGCSPSIGGHNDNWNNGSGNNNYITEVWPL